MERECSIAGNGGDWRSKSRPQMLMRSTILNRLLFCQLRVTSSVVNVQKLKYEDENLFY